MNKKKNNLLFGIFAVIFIGVFAIWMVMNPVTKHIEDTNGKDDTTLQTITEEDVKSMKMGARGGLTTSETSYNFGGLNVSNGIRYSCKKFTGVQMLHTCYILKGSDIHVSLPEFEIKEGNFAFYVIFDGEIVGKVEPNGSGISEFLLENIEKNGTLEYVIAGESANFKFVAPAEW